MNTRLASIDDPSSSAESLRQRMQNSISAHRRATESLALAAPPPDDGLGPIYVDSVSGAHLFDIDGNSYIDLTMGYGAHVLGHRPAVVEQAAREQLGKGWHFGLHNTAQFELAELINKALPSAERCAFCNSGSEATQYLMRIARAATGRTLVGVFDSTSHGSHDYALVRADPASPRSHPTSKALGRGVPDVVADTMLQLPYNDEAAFDLIAAHKDELAIVLIEPIQTSNPHKDIGPFLKELERVCRRHGILFGLDEVVTGFRVAFGGAQELFGLLPDLTALGKNIGGGFPVGAVAGRLDLMTMLWGPMNRRHPIDESVVWSGIFAGNPITMAAGAAVVRHLDARRDDIYPYLAAQGDRLTEAVNAFCKAEAIPVQILNFGSILHVFFQSTPIRSGRDVEPTDAGGAAQSFRAELLARGVLLPAINWGFLSVAHTPELVDAIIEGFTGSLAALRANSVL